MSTESTLIDIAIRLKDSFAARETDEREFSRFCSREPQLLRKLMERAWCDWSIVAGRALTSPSYGSDNQRPGEIVHNGCRQSLECRPK
jgi:hypothetical protein